MPSAIAYAIMTQVVKTVPATATFVAGVELDTDGIAVTHDAAGAQPVDSTRPLDFGRIPNFGDLRAWNPFDSQCVYVHNRSDRPDLGPPSTLMVDVFFDDQGTISGRVELASGETCDDPGYRGAHTLEEGRRTVAPGEMFRARVRMHLDRSPGEGPVSFDIRFVGIGTEEAEPPVVAADVVESDNTHLMVNMRFPRPRLLTVQTPDGPHLRVAMPGLDTVAGDSDSSGQPETCVDRRLAAVPRGGAPAAPPRSVSPSRSRRSWV